MLILALSLFFTDPAPLDMPRAEAFLVREDGRMCLEDRYSKLDLWTSQAVTGRWIDEDGREFLLASLDFEPPAIDAGETLTREDYAERRVPMKRIRANRKFPEAFRRAVSLLSASCALTADEPRHARQLPRGYRDVDYWQHPTNYAAVVCAFRPEKSETWYLALWKLAEGDDYAERMAVFEDRFLRQDFPAFQTSRPASAEVRPASERNLLRADVRHSVEAYANWRFSDSAEFAVIDDLPARGAVEALTNEFAVMRAKYAAAMPTPIDGSNVLCVARLYASREEYVEALATDGLTNMMWSAAYWSPERRELVAYLPVGGEAELLKTVRHEAFHQYLSYASSMIPVSPWLNEGYAQYFEDVDSEDWGAEYEITKDSLDALGRVLPGILGLDYRQFYDGTDRERRLRYRLAWSVAVFLEKGADKVRFRPFAGLKRDYFKALLETHDMRDATLSAFGSADGLKLFVDEWKKFWRDR